MNEQRGQDIQRRRLRLGISSVSEFARETDIDRQTVVRAEAGKASPRTYLLLESWLQDKEDELGMETSGGNVTHAVGSGKTEALAEDMIEFSVGGDFGVNVVVRGPLSKMDELEGAVGRLLDRLRSETPSGEGSTRAG